MDNCPVNCTFAWHGVIPPSHCPHCGRCLGCGGPAPWYPRPPYPVVPRPQPYWTLPSSTITMSGGVSDNSPEVYL